jgi:two-component sensor histidine kinase
VDEERSAEQSGQIEALVATPDLADALESEQFRRFLDQVPIAIVVSQMGAKERIVYVNPEFERVCGVSAASLEGKPWSVLQYPPCQANADLALGPAIAEGSDFLGTFLLSAEDKAEQRVDAYSNVIQDEAGVPAFRFAALVKVGIHKQEERDELEKRIREKDALLMEVQHRVKNNLQMITALMRIEARNADGLIDTAPFRRLAGRIEAIKILYALLDPSSEGEVDLGVYLSDVAAAVLHAHAVEGVRLELKVDAYPVSVNVAMPAGLVVNELLTNALKHAFVGRPGGTITLESVSDGTGCRVTVADNGVGLPEGVEWPQRGKLSALIVQSLRENAKAKVQVASVPGQGMRVTLIFTRAASAPQPVS